MNDPRLLLRITLALALVGFAPVVADDKTTLLADPNTPLADPNATPKGAQDSRGEAVIPEPAFWDKAPPPDRTIDPADPFAAGSDASNVSGQVLDRGREEPKPDAGPARPLRIKQVTFRVPPDKARSLDASRRRADDTALFNTLDDLAEHGEIQVIADFDFRAVGGRMAGLEAKQEFIYPTEFEPDGELGIVSPTAFETRNLGTACSLIPRARGRAVQAEVRVQRTRWAGFSGWVAARPNEAADPFHRCLVRQPIMLTEHFRGTMMSNRPGPRLIGVQPEAQAPSAAAKASAAWLYTFLHIEETRPTGPGAESAPVAEGDDLALEVIVVPVARDEAARWLAGRGAKSDDAADLDELLRRAVEKSGVSVPSRWFLRAASGPVRPGGPPQAGIDSITEFIYPTEWEPGLSGSKLFCPTAFETRNCGSSFEAQATWAAGGGSVLVNASLSDIMLEEMEEWPSSIKGQSQLYFELPRFRVRGLTSEVAVPVNGVRFVGMRNARLPPGDGDESHREGELLFLRADGTPHLIAPEARPAPPVIEAQAVVFSVSVAAAMGMSHESDEARRVTAMWNAGSRDEARIVQVFAGAVCLGGSLSTSDRLESIHPTEIGSVGDDFTLTAFDCSTHGAELALRPHLVGGAMDCRIRFQWESAPLSRPILEDFRKFALDRIGDFPTPKFFQETVAGDGAAVPSDGEWHILSFQECAAPETAPEHGRWHAAVVRVLNMGDRR